MVSRISRLEPESRRFSISATARTPPYDSRLNSPSAFSFWPITPAILKMISGEIWSRLAMRRETSARSPDGSEVSSAAACEDIRCESTSAMVCGCSL